MWFWYLHHGSTLVISLATFSSYITLVGIPVYSSSFVKLEFCCPFFSWGTVISIFHAITNNVAKTVSLTYFLQFKVWDFPLTHTERGFASWRILQLLLHTVKLLANAWTNEHTMTVCRGFMSHTLVHINHLYYQASDMLFLVWSWKILPWCLI